MMNSELLRSSRVFAYAAFLLVTVVSPAISQPITSSGIIAFRSNQDWNPAVEFSENSEIYLVSPDSKEVVRLTTDPEWDGIPSLSEDGSRLFFFSTRASKVGTYSLELNPQVGQPQRVVPPDGVTTNLLPSADGRLLAFTSENGNELWLNILDLKSGSRRKVVLLLGGLYGLTFVPDNKRIIFTSSRGGGRDPADIWIVNVDGTQKKLIGRGSWPHCNPQGTRVVFELSGSIRTMNLDGSDVRQVTPFGIFSSNPSYSPDGAHIVFDSNMWSRSARGIFASEALGVRTGRNIYIMRNDGTEVQRLTFGVGSDTQPVWSVKYGFAYSPPPPPPTTPSPLIESLAQTSATDLVLNLIAPNSTPSQVFQKGELVYAFNNLKNSPYASFVGVQSNGKPQIYRLQGPRLQGTDGDFVFDPQLLPGSNDALIKLGDPAVRARNPYNSYRLWNWNRTTNALTSAAPRELFFRQVASAPDGARIAYIAGGNALGQTPEENGGLGEPLRLYVYNPQTQQETLVSDNSGVRGGFAWLDATTLLYTAVPAPAKTAFNTRAFARPAIYAFDVTSGQSTLLLNEARHPIPSPDGSRFIFWGLGDDEDAVPLPDTWWQNTGYAKLSVANRDGSGRRAYGRIIGAYPSLVWAPDNQAVFWLRPSKGSPHAEASVETWNVVTNKARVIGKLSARDTEAVERAWFQPQFRALEVAPDVKSLFVAVEEVAEDGKVMSRVQAVDLVTGKATEVAQLENAAGFDWRATPKADAQ